jgi:HEAT repeat protein
MRHAPQSLLLLGLALLAACADPKDLAGWAERAESRNRLDEKLAALASARKAPTGDAKVAVTALAKILKQDPTARALAAITRGELGAPSAAPALVEALDAAGKVEGEVSRANVAIATALGALKAREAVPALARAARSPDAFTQVAAIDALGAIGDPAAVEPLLATVGDEQAEPFAVKKALLALGRLGDARAVPAVVRMLFTERPGVSFFPEAAFAASQLGPPMSPPLVALVEGRDAELSRWAAERGRVADARQGVLVALAQVRVLLLGAGPGGRARLHRRRAGGAALRAGLRGRVAGAAAGRRGGGAPLRGAGQGEGPGPARALRGRPVAHRRPGRAPGAAGRGSHRAGGAARGGAGGALAARRRGGAAAPGGGPPGLR